MPLIQVEPKFRLNTKAYLTIHFEGRDMDLEFPKTREQGGDQKSSFKLPAMQERDPLEGVSGMSQVEL